MASTPRRSQSEGATLSPPASSSFANLRCHLPPVIVRKKLLGGGEGVTLQPAKILVFQRGPVMDPVLILTSSLDTSLQVLVLVSRQN